MTTGAQLSLTQSLGECPPHSGWVFLSGNKLTGTPRSPEIVLMVTLNPVKLTMKTDHHTSFAQRCAKASPSWEHTLGKSTELWFH